MPQTKSSARAVASVRGQSRARARLRKNGTNAGTTGPQMSAVDFVVEEIRNGIRERRYAPGQRLIEADLVERLGLGRGTVRDALRRLAGDGVVSIEHQKGAVVRFLTRDEFISLIQVREVLEGLAARLAAGKVDKGNYRKRLTSMVKEIKDGMVSGAIKVGEYMDHNDALHNLIIEMSEDAYLAAAIKQSHVTLFRLQFHFMSDAESNVTGHAAHEKIVQAILAGDAKRAEREMRSHVHNSIKLVNRASERIFRPSNGAA